MKIILTEPGFENYTGQFGVNNFVNGKSVDDVKPHDAVRISAVMKATWENGVIPTPETEYGKLVEMTAPIVPDQVPASEKAEHRHHDAIGETGVTPPTSLEGYTQESLGEIADREGIAGVRRVADAFGVKARSIPELIAEILQAQAGKQAKSE